MKKYIQVTSICLCLAIINIAGMDLERLEDHAWRQAFDGNSAAALEEFTEAAQNGSWQACQLLAHNYGKNPLLTDTKDEQKALFFLELADSYEKQNKKSENFLKELYLKRDLQKLETLRFTQNNKWYQQILAEIDLKDFPPPEEGLLELFSKITRGTDDNQEKQQLMELFCSSLRLMPSKNVTSEVLETIEKRIRSIDLPTHCTLELLMALKEVPTEFELSAQIKKAYSKLISGYYCSWHEKDEIRSILADFFVKTFTLHAAISQSEAIESLICVLDEDIDSSWRFDRNTLVLLRLLPNETLNRYATEKLLPKCCETFIKTVYENTDLAASFNNTVLDINIIANKALQLNKKDNSMDILGAFFKYGDPLFYQKYETEIIAALPSFLEDYNYEIVIAMATQTQLQTAAIQALIEHSSRTKHETEREEIIEKLLKKATFNEHKIEFIYQYMNSIYQQSENINCLMLLWNHIYNNDLTRKNFLADSILHYFGNPDSLASVKTQGSFSDFFTEVLRFASEKNTISYKKFKKALISVYETGLSTTLDPTFLAEKQDAIIFDEWESFKERAKFLAQRLKTLQSHQKDSEDFFKKLETRIVKEDFKIYTQNIHTTLLKSSSSFDICRAKRTLNELHKKYDVPLEISSVAPGPLKNFSRGSSPDRIFLRHHLIERPQIDSNGLIYCFEYREQNFSLWALDEKSLIAVWQAPLKSKKLETYAFDDTRLYLSNGSNIHIFNKETGQELGVYCLPYKTPISFLGTNRDGLLCVVQAERENSTAVVSSVNTSTSDIVIISQKIDDGFKKYFVADRTFCIYNVPDQTLHFYPKGLAKKTSICCDNEYFRTHLAAKNKLILFSKRTAKNTVSLVCLDAADASEKWEFPLQEQLKTQPAISEDGKYIFILLRDNHIIALKNNENKAEKHWEIEIPNKEKSRFDSPIDEIAISNNGKTLFGLQKLSHSLSGDSGLLYTIDTESGRFFSSCKRTGGKSQHLIGVTQEGLPCIQT